MMIVAVLVFGGEIDNVDNGAVVVIFPEQVNRVRGGVKNRNRTPRHFPDRGEFLHGDRRARSSNDSRDVHPVHQRRPVFAVVIHHHRRDERTRRHGIEKRKQSRQFRLVVRRICGHVHVRRTSMSSPVLLFIVVVIVVGHGLSVYTAASAVECLRGGRNGLKEYLRRLARIATDAIEVQPRAVLAVVINASHTSYSWKEHSSSLELSREGSERSVALENEHASRESRRHGRHELGRELQILRALWIIFMIRRTT